MLHIYAMRGTFYLPSIETGTRGRQFNISSKRHPAGILLMKVLGKFWILRPGFEPGTSNAAGKCFTHMTTQLPKNQIKLEDYNCEAVIKIPPDLPQSLDPPNTFSAPQIAT